MYKLNSACLRVVLAGTCLITGLLLGCSKESPTSSTDDIQSGQIGPGDVTVTKIKGLVSAVNNEKSIIWLQVTRMKVFSSDETTISQVLETKEVISISLSEISINDLIIVTGHFVNEVTHNNGIHKITNSSVSQSTSSFMADLIDVYKSTSDTCDTCGFWSLCDSTGTFADSCWTQYPADTCWGPCDSTNPNDSCLMVVPCTQ